MEDAVILTDNEHRVSHAVKLKRQTFLQVSIGKTNSERQGKRVNKDIRAAGDNDTTRSENNQATGA